ncbi:MAG: hypothetical protein ACOC04_03560 [Halothece sp.]
MMITQNFRIEADIRPETYTKLRQFMEENQLPESQAINRILQDYLEPTIVSENYLMTPDPNTQPPERVALPKQSPLPENLAKKALTEEELAEFLQCDPAELHRIRDYPVVLTDYTRDRDPRGMAWEYDPNAQRYFPMKHSIPQKG